MSDADLDKRLADARARIEAVEARKAEKQAARLQLEEVERAEREAIEAEKLEELEAEHGELGKDIAKVDTDLGMIVVKRSNRLAFDRFNLKMKKTPEDWQKFVEPCVIYPDKAQFIGIRDVKPAVLTQCADALYTLAGQKAEEDAGK